MGSFIPGQASATDDIVNTPLLLQPGDAPLKDILLSLRTGKTRPLAGVKLRSAIHKGSRHGRVFATEIGLVGDEQQYAMHGGIDKALHQYCSAHYAVWNSEVPNRAHLFTIGGFGENLSSALLSEESVCIGDRFRLGNEGVVVEVSQPRAPCYKLNHRFEYKKTSSTAQSTGRTGWYLRVVKTGYIQEGDEFELIERVNPRWPLSRVQWYLYHDVNNVKAMTELAQLPRLGQETLDVFHDRLAHGVENMSGRLEGERIPIVWRSYKVVEKTAVTPRVKKFVLEVDATSADVEESYDASLGRFPHVRLQFGPNLMFSRAYSVISGDMRRFELGVARDDNSRGGSVYLHDQVQIGQIIKVAKGHDAKNLPGSQQDCTDTTTTKKHFFIVGGIGVTAFLHEVMLRELSSLCHTSEDFEVHYAVRNWKEAAYLEYLPNKHTTVYAKSDGKRLDLTKIVPPPRSGTVANVIYCCGPPSLLKTCKDLTTKLRYPRPQVHFEKFGGTTTGTGDAFEAEIKSTGQVLQVPREKSLLQILNEAGFEVESSCLVGNCGTCMVDYCKGEVVHHGIALEEDQQADSMLSCVSRGKGRIVVDC